MNKPITTLPDPRHDAAQALAWLDALEPVIRACRLRGRKVGVEMLVQGLRHIGIEAITVSRAVQSSHSPAMSMDTAGLSSDFIHLPCVQGQLFSFDGFEGPQAWAIALSNHHARQQDKLSRYNQRRGFSDRHHHTSYVALGKNGGVGNPGDAPARLDATGKLKLSNDDAAVLEELIKHLSALDLPPPSLPVNDERLACHDPARPSPLSTPTPLEQRFLRIWQEMEPKATPLPGRQASNMCDAVMECLSLAGIRARLLYRSLSYRGQMEVFNIDRLAVEFEPPGHAPRLVCLSAPGGWEGLVEAEMQSIQSRPGDRLRAGEIAVVDQLVSSSPALDPRTLEAIASVFSSHLLGLSVQSSDQPATAPRPRL